MDDYIDELLARMGEFDELLMHDEVLDDAEEMYAEVSSSVFLDW